MKYLLPNNRAAFNATYKAGLSSAIYIPLNTGRYVGPDNQSALFKSRPETDSVNLADWITNQITLGNITLGSADNNGVYSGSGEIFTDALATVNNTFTIKSDSSPVTIQTLWDDSLNLKTWSTTTRTQFDDRRSFISVDSKYDNSASSTITLSATNDSSTGTITVEEDNITFSAGVLGQSCSLDDNGFSIQVDGGNYYFPGWQPTALANHYIQTWVSGSAQWQRLAIGPGYANDGAAATGGVAIGQIYLNTTNNAMHVRLT